MAPSRLTSPVDRTWPAPAPTPSGILDPTADDTEQIMAATVEHDLIDTAVSAARDVLPALVAALAA